jgi:hypothetical protein
VAPHVAREALEVIENDNVPAPTGTEVIQKRHHPWPLHEVTAARYIVEEDRTRRNNVPARSRNRGKFGSTTNFVA